MQDEKFSIKKRIHSFKHAWNGLRILIKEEHNARVHIFAAIIIIISGLLLKISNSEWIAIVFAIGIVISLEIVNSAIENIADFVSPEKHERIKTIKDLAAAAVLIGALSALTIGLIIFVPKLLNLL